MARIIKEFSNGNLEVVASIGNDRFAYEVYDAIKETDEQLAIVFMERYRYFKICGHTMA